MSLSQACKVKQGSVPAAASHICVCKPIFFHFRFSFHFFFCYLKIQFVIFLFFLLHAFLSLYFSAILVHPCFSFICFSLSSGPLFSVFCQHLDLEMSKILIHTVSLEIKSLLSIYRLTTNIHLNKTETNDFMSGS